MVEVVWMVEEVMVLVDDDRGTGPFWRCSGSGAGLLAGLHRALCGPGGLEEEYGWLSLQAS